MYYGWKWANIIFVFNKKVMVEVAFFIDHMYVGRRIENMTVLTGALNSIVCDDLFDKKIEDNKDNQ